MNERTNLSFVIFVVVESGLTDELTSSELRTQCCTFYVTVPVGFVSQRTLLTSSRSSLVTVCAITQRFMVAGQGCHIEYTTT